MDAALELFAERGFYGTTMPLVAERANVVAATMYRHFPTKEVLVNEVFKREKAAFVAAVVDGFPFEGSFRAQLHHFWTRVCAYAAAEPLAAIFLDLHRSGPYLDEESRCIESEVVRSATAFVERALASRVVKDLPASLIVAVIWGSYRATVRDLNDGQPMDGAAVWQLEQCIWEAIRR